MSPLQRISALLLVCLHLHLGQAQVGGGALWCNDTIVANITATAQRTGAEALNVISIAERYLGRESKSEQIQGMEQNRTVIGCGTTGFLSQRNPSSELQETANVFRNLNQLLHMYYSVWRNMELYEENERDFVETESPKLDMLGIVFSSFSYQVERYLQVRHCSCDQTECTMEDIDKEWIQQEIERLQSDQCTNKKLLNTIILDLIDLARDTLHTLPGGVTNYGRYGYIPLCHSLGTLPQIPDCTPTF